MDAWKEWIGPSPARTLIAMECKAVADLNKASKRSGTNQDTESERLDGKAREQLDWPTEDQQHFYVYPIPKFKAAVIWIGGRSFLIGVPKGVHEKLPAADLPDNVILLSWAPEHTEGLRDYWKSWDDKLTGTQLRVWTSEWIWEHLVEAGVAPSETMRESAEAPRSGTQEPRVARTTFETQHVEYFAPRIELSLAYSVGEIDPQLFAHFRFFDSHLIVALQQAAPGTSSPVGLLPVGDYQRLIGEIYRSYPQSRAVLAAIVEKRLKQLSDAEVLGPLTRERGSWWYRYSLRPGTFEQVLRPGCGEPGEMCHSEAQPAPGWVGCFADVGERSIISGGVPLNALFEDESSWNRESFRAWAGQADRPRDAAAPDPPQTATGSRCSREVSLVIGCGAPPTRWHGKLTPDRRLVLGERDVSALEAKLLQFAAQPQTGDPVFSQTIYVLVSPAMEDVVRDELVRIRRDHPDRFDGVRFEILRNRVVPRYEHEHQSLRLFRQRDGGFQYNPAGHLEVIWCLHKVVNHGLFYYTNLTNMGINVTDEVDVLRQHMAAIDAAAVFELVLHEEHKEGVGPGSYWVANGDGNALIKPVYCGCEREGRHTWPGDRDAVARANGGLYMSTGSVLLDMARFQGHQLQTVAAVPHFARPRRPLRTPSRDIADDKRWTVQMERDLDQITWVKGLKCSGVVIQSVEGSPRRFFAVKQEADLYQKSYQELSSLYSGLPQFCAAGQPAGLIHNTPLALVGAEQHDPWGDGLLRHLKGVLRSDVDVSETWESSAYPKGVSLVEKNALETVSLRDVVPGLGESMNVMGKLLDCAGNLSIQVHPSDRVCKALRYAGREIEDDVGKEENFFVVRATGERVFYLGLDAQKIRAVFGWPGAAASEGDPFQKAVDGKRDEIDLFGKQALGTLETSFSDLLLETLRSGPVPAQAILQLRRAANSEQPLTDEALAGILFVMALKTVTRVVSGDRALYLRADGEIDHLRTFALQYLNKVEGIRPGTIIHVPPGVVHAAGPGCFLVEASGQSDNTFRIFDHGREYEPEARRMHYEHAAVALSDDTFLDKIKQRRLVNLGGGLPSDASLKMTAKQVAPRGRRGAAAQQPASFPCNDPETHGHTLICTGGRLLVSATWSGKPSRVVSVGQAHSLFLLPGASLLTIRAAEHEVSFYSLFCSHTKPVTPRLAIAVGGTHFQFVYRAYPEPPRCDTHLWYDLLAESNDFSWQMRLSRLRSELSSFLGGVPKVSLCAVSWPGTILGTGDQAKLTAHILGCGGTAVQELCRGTALDSSDCRVMFDADADLAAELKEVGGQLQGKSGNPLPGWQLNFASEVCMSVASVAVGLGGGTSVAEVNSAVTNPKGQRLAVGPIGRMLWFDPMSRDWHLTEDLRTQPSKAPEGLPSGVIRLSDMLSTTGVALRLLASELGQKFLSESGETNYATELWKCWMAAQEVATFDRGGKIANLIQEFRPHLNAAIADMFSWLDKAPDRCEFVDEIGRDYGDVIAALLAELPVLQSTKVVVLGGVGGSHFGRKGERFLKAVSGQLHAGNRFREMEVRRAAASGSPFRLLHAPDWGDLFT